VTDIHGNTSAPATFAVTVDTTPPAVTFDAATEDALADGFLSAGEDRLAGLVNDNFEAVSLEFCAVAENGYAECVDIDTQPIGSAAGNWARRIPLGESDGVTQTLRFTGLDGAGNRSTPVTRTFQLDTVAPVVTATLGAAGISGVVSDGGGIGSVRLRVEPPSGAPFWVDATRNGNQWSLVFTNAAAGVYTLYVEATDRAGNRAAAGPFTLTLTNGGSESTIYLPVVVYEQSKERPTYLPLITR
jgi:large repetitive protein